MIHYVVVRGSHWIPEDILGDLNLFGSRDEPYPPIHFTDTGDLPKLLVELGVYPSTSKARQAGRIGPVPSGFSDLKASKKSRVHIWNPGSYAEELLLP